MANECGSIYTRLIEMVWILCRLSILILFFYEILPSNIMVWALLRWRDKNSLDMNHTWNSILMKECALIWGKRSGNEHFKWTLSTEAIPILMTIRSINLYKMIIINWSRIFSFPDMLCTLFFKAKYEHLHYIIKMSSDNHCTSLTGG